MTPEAQRIAIAQVFGWKSYPYIVIKGRRYDGPHWSNAKDFNPDNPPIGECASTLNCIPNYVNDLNLMHEAESTLESSDNKLVSIYFEALHRVVGAFSDNPQWAMIHATAAQRAEAFLKTVGKWVEEVVK